MRRLQGNLGRLQNAPAVLVGLALGLLLAAYTNTANADCAGIVYDLVLESVEATDGGNVQTESDFWRNQGRFYVYGGSSSDFHFVEAGVEPSEDNFFFIAER